MTRDELAQFDGRDSRKAYVAVNNTIYDFTSSKMWQNGDHQGAHQAGCDLTEELKDAPHVRAVIERFPVAGRLETSIDISEKKRGKGVLIGIGILIIFAIIFAAIMI